MAEQILVASCSLAEYTAAVEHFCGGGSVSFLQAPFYGAWQATDGKTVVYYAARQGEEVLAAGLAVLYTAPGGLKFLYSPYGPLCRKWTDELLESIRSYFRTVAAELGASFVRLDTEGVSTVSKPIDANLAATASLQPRAEWVLDISGDQEAIWMGMHKHARYNVRLAERANARLDLYAPADAPADMFLSLMRTTAGRDSFSLQTEQYYRAVLASVPGNNGFVTICTIDDTPAAVALFVEFDGVMHYVFAGSSDEFRKIAPPYFVIWNAVLEAKQRGWKTLNFGGISDDVKGQHLAGVTSFKKRFGGYKVTHSNPIDLVYKPFKYTLFKLYKSLR